MDETIKVKENLKDILDMFRYFEHGNIKFFTLHQVEPEERVITINPKHFAKVDYYEVEEVEE
jgi:hypothetical protein